MRSIITVGQGVEIIIPALLCIWLFGKCLLFRVVYFLENVGIPKEELRKSNSLTAAVWLFTLFCFLAVWSPSQLPEKIWSLFFLSFLLQAGTTDAASGYLPLTFTRRFMLAGLLASGLSAISTEILLNRILETAGMGLLMITTHKVINRKAEKIGRGDLWLIAAFSAWGGIQYAATIAAGGLAAFTCWHISRNTSEKKEGPLGPWLCVSGGLVLLEKLYNPIWIIAS